MWPALFGAGWYWGALLAAVLVCVFVTVLGLLFRVVAMPSRPQPDDLADAWHRYEEGDLTRPEWDRTLRRLALSRPPAHHRAA